MMNINNLLLSALALVAMAAVAPKSALAFTSIATAPCVQTRTARLFSTETDISQTILSVSWEKPLGMILEEVEEGAAKGVYILELAEEGAAAQAPEKDQVVGSKLLTVMGEDVTSITFDQVMEQLINAPSPVDLSFEVVDSSSSSSSEGEEEDDSGKVEFEIGTPVSVVVQVEGEPDKTIEAKVGDNLRTVLQQNDVVVYRTFKAKIGNCGGGGQCGFCAVEFVDSEGWEPRSDYEDNKIKNNPNARLACLNNIQGPVTIKM